MKLNPYEVLGVPADATPEQLKQARRKLARKHHPDLNQDNSEAMTAINVAYELLSDPQRRKHFDETGSVDQEPSVDELAAGILQQLFQAAMVQSGNFMRHVHSNLSQGQQKVRADIMNFEKQLSNLERHKKHVRCKGPVNVAQQLIESKIEQIQLTLKQTQKALAVGQAVEKLVAQYESTEVEHAGYANPYQYQNGIASMGM